MPKLLEGYEQDAPQKAHTGQGSNKIKVAKGRRNKGAKDLKGERGKEGAEGGKGEGGGGGHARGELAGEGRRARLYQYQFKPKPRWR